MKPTPTIIAQVLLHRYPDIYEQLKKECLTTPFTQEDIDGIWAICELEPDRTKVVIVAVLLLYSPQTVSIGIKTRKGLISAIAKTKGSTQAAVSMQVPVAIEWYKVYHSFREKVDKIIDGLKKQKI